jgi:DNA-binding MarR family transcriptional regulator
MRTEQLVSHSEEQLEYLKLGIKIQARASELLHFASGILRPYRITFQQYNVLRILKAKAPHAVSVKFISDNMVDSNSNGSRLVDKLVSKKLAIKLASEKDKRTLNVQITPSGLALVNEATLYLEAQIINKMQSITIEEAKIMNTLLAKLSYFSPSV